MGRTPRAAALPPDSTLEFPSFLSLHSLLTSLFVFPIPYFLPDVSCLSATRVWYAAVCLLKEKKNEEKKKTILFDCTCGNTPDFYLTSFSAFVTMFLLTVFLCFYCTHAVTDDVEKDRERERTREKEQRNWKKVQDLFSLMLTRHYGFKQIQTYTEQRHENESNSQKQNDRTKMYILVVFTQHL